MSRNEFTKSTKRDAYARSGGKCEATGELYGLQPGQRCGADLRIGVEYDHIQLDANSHDNSLENCCAACPRCHRFKTTKHDIPRAAKTVRQRDKGRNIRTNPSRGFRKPPPGWRFSWRTGRMEKMDV